MSADLPDVDAVLAQIAADPTSLPAVLGATRLLRSQAATLAAVRELHERGEGPLDQGPPVCTHCVVPSDTGGEYADWPCCTIRALDGDPDA